MTYYKLTDLLQNINLTFSRLWFRLSILLYSPTYIRLRLQATNKIMMGTDTSYLRRSTSLDDHLRKFQLTVGMFLGCSSVFGVLPEKLLK